MAYSYIMYIIVLTKFRYLYVVVENQKYMFHWEVCVAKTFLISIQILLEWCQM